MALSPLVGKVLLPSQSTSDELTAAALCIFPLDNPEHKFYNIIVLVVPYQPVNRAFASPSRMYTCALHLQGAVHVHSAMPSTIRF